MRIPRFVAILLITMLLASPAAAVEKRIAERWGANLVTTTKMLKAGSYDQALPILKNTIDEMLLILGPGDETTYVFIVPLIQTALAEEGLGDHAAAIWHWQMAQTLYPKAAESDLSGFGAPGEALKRNILSNPNPPACLHSGSKEPRAKVLKTFPPKYPEGARQFRERGIVIVNLTIAEDGSISEPRVVKPLPTPLTYAALESIRLWKFAPATVDGNAIQSDFCITVNYKLTK
jgi:TonB family protein